MKSSENSINDQQESSDERFQQLDSDSTSDDFDDSDEYQCQNGNQYIFVVDT